MNANSSDLPWQILLNGSWKWGVGYIFWKIFGFYIIRSFEDLKTRVGGKGVILREETGKSSSEEQALAVCGEARNWRGAQAARAPVLWYGKWAPGSTLPNSHYLAFPFWLFGSLSLPSGLKRNIFKSPLQCLGKGKRGTSMIRGIGKERGQSARWSAHGLRRVNQRAGSSHRLNN